MNAILFISMWASDRHEHLIRREVKRKERGDQSGNTPPCRVVFPLSIIHLEDSLEVYWMPVPGSGSSMYHET